MMGSLESQCLMGIDAGDTLDGAAVLSHHVVSFQLACSGHMKLTEFRDDLKMTYRAHNALMEFGRLESQSWQLISNRALRTPDILRFR
jgi:hypothetical protein